MTRGHVERSRDRLRGTGGAPPYSARARTVSVVARYLAPAALIAVVAAAALAVAGTGTGTAPQRASERVRPPAGPPPPTVTPGLRTLAELGMPGGPGQIDSGVGIYPALTATRRLVFPGADAIERARCFARSRDGQVAFAVADERGGLSGRGAHRTFPSASLIKAMILVAYLRKTVEEGAEPSRSDLLTLGYMIRLSDNDSADTMYARVGDEALLDLARRAGMQQFEIAGDWGNATVTAADQARFFLRLDRLVPPRYRELARDLLETVSELQSWGIPAGARPQWRVFFKGGWRPEDEGEMVHQAALLESGSRRVAIAVMTLGSPDMIYGEKSIQGVAERLVDGAPGAALPPPHVCGGQPAASREAGREVGSSTSAW